MPESLSRPPKAVHHFRRVAILFAGGPAPGANAVISTAATSFLREGTEVIANRLLESAGLNPGSDLAAQRLDLTKTVDGMKEGAIDAMFFSGGLPTPGITDLVTTAGDEVTFIDVTPQLTRMQTISSAYEPSVIPAATYGLPADVPTIAVANLLVARDDLDANLACVLTRTLFDRKTQLEQAVSAAKGISLDNARDTAPVPLNRGAQRALDDLKAPQ
jgi:TRAP transporter TAXI family solute receptor